MWKCENVEMNALTYSTRNCLYKKKPTMRSYQSLAEALDDLRKRGYDADFEPQSNYLYCSALDLRLEEEEFHIDEVYRFEGNANPPDSSVVYAFTSPTGVKGTIVDRLEAPANNPVLK
jgi:hypothetical protein